MTEADKITDFTLHVGIYFCATVYYKYRGLRYLIAFSQLGCLPGICLGGAGLKVQPLSLARSSFSLLVRKQFSSGVSVISRKNSIPFNTFRWVYTVLVGPFSII